MLRRQPRLVLLLVMAHHAGLRQRERREHADRVQRDQRRSSCRRRPTMSTPASDARARARRCENTSRSPRFASWRGQVAVAGDDRRQPREVGVRRVRGEGEDAGRRELEDAVQTKPSPNTCWPICENTADLSRAGYGCRWCASTDTPRNSVPRMTRHPHERDRRVPRLGRRNAGTPFEIASTPVSATAPDEKPRQQQEECRACRRSSARRPSAPRACAASNGIGG